MRDDVIEKLVEAWTCPITLDVVGSNAVMDPEGRLYDGDAARQANVLR